MRVLTSITLFLSFILFGCGSGNGSDQQSTTEKQQSEPKNQEMRIVTLNGAITEIIAAAGETDKIVGVDVTSNYPQEVQKLPKVGHNMKIQAEGILSLEPTLVLGNEGNIKPEVREQLKQSGVELIMFPEREYSVEGTNKLIKNVCEAIDKPEKSSKIISSIKTDLSKLNNFEEKPKVLFIYARGAGTTMIGGIKTPMNTIIEMAGGKNAITEIEEYQPLTSEALVEANPDAVLLFNSGAGSLNGSAGIVKLPGMKATTAGKNKNFIVMDGALLSNFGPRVGKAALELNQKLSKIK
jgi:iron complex transport system substrate-binding protein